MTIAIRYAETDDDVIAIHRFLCAVAKPPAPIDAKDSISEIWRVCAEDVGLMAVHDSRLVGTIGIIKVPYWFNRGLGYLTNRWFEFVPGHGIQKPLLHEARAIAQASDLVLELQYHHKGRIKFFNTKARRLAARQ